MVIGEAPPPPQMELAYSRLLSFDIGRAQSDASEDAQQQEEAQGAVPPYGYDVLVSRRDASAPAQPHALHSPLPARHTCACSEACCPAGRCR